MTEYTIPPQSVALSAMPEELKPREKALSQGIKSLTDAELMALIFATGIRGKNVVDMCDDILKDNGYHISKVARMDVREFISRYKGIGPAKALTMLAALELGARSAADELKVEDPPISSSDVAFTYMKEFLDGLDHEEFWVLLLKQNLKVKKAVRIGQGGLSSTAVDIKIILREALLANSPMIMLFHNHPSGNLKPSEQDRSLTRRIIQATSTVDIKTIDHIIIAGSAFYSFHDNGEL